MNYLEYLKKKWNDMLAGKVEEQGISGGGTNAGSGGSSGSGDSGVKKDSPLDELESFIKEQYSGANYNTPQLPDAPTYERMETNSISDTEIEDAARDSLKEYENLTKNSIEDEIRLLEKKYSADKESAKSGYEKAEAGLEDIYGTAKEKASNDMLKRGLARSSVSANVVAGLEGELADKKEGNLNAYIEGIAAIDSELSSLEGQRQKALNDFNISYAAKLTEKINTLKKERDDKTKEALKYNNTLTEKEYEQQTQKQLDESKLYSDELSQAQKEKELGTLTKAQKERIYQNTYEKMDETLAALTKSEAKKLLNSSTIFRDNLSDYYYYKLIDKYGR